MQYPQMGLLFANNPDMDIKNIIADNLNSWMSGHPRHNTNKLLEKASEVGASTIQRLRNAQGNPTAEHIASICRAFGKQPHELLTPNTTSGEKQATMAMEPEANQDKTQKEQKKIIYLMEKMNIEQIELLADIAKAVLKFTPQRNEKTGPESQLLSVSTENITTKTTIIGEDGLVSSGTEIQQKYQQ